MKVFAINSCYNLATKSTKDKTLLATQEKTQESKNNMLGLVGLGILAVGGLGYGIYKHNDAKKIAKTLEETKIALEEAKNKLNIQDEKVSIVEKALKAANEKIKELMTRLGL